MLSTNRGKVYSYSGPRVIIPVCQLRLKAGRTHNCMNIEERVLIA